MASHFLLSAAARTLSLKGDLRCRGRRRLRHLCKLRWPEKNGEAVCPECGSLGAYKITTCRRFKCSECLKQFSVTSGTIFASRKLSFTDLLAAICLFINSAKGRSAVQFSREMDVQYKTAWVMAHKLREAMQDEYEGEHVGGEVEIVGAYFDGHIRPSNKAENRVDRRLAEHQTGTRRVVVALRERGGRTLTHVVKAEAEGVAIAAKTIEAGSTVFADESRHWDALSRKFPTARINHQQAYSLGNGPHEQRRKLL